MKVLKLKDHNKEVEFFVNQGSILESMINENNYVPRFTLNDLELFNDIPVNEPLKFTNEVAIKAIKYGLIMLINYKGAEDKNFSGHERVIYFMVLGRSQKGKQLLRGYHLSGWSVSKNTTVDKEWRMFRTDRILSMTFTGSFFRLAPDGYQPDDKGMRGGIIASADFDEIRKNQSKLLKTQKIQDRDDVSIENKDEDRGFATILIEDAESELNLNEFMENAIISSIEDLDNLRITFLKSVYGNDFIAVLGAIGKPGNIVKVKGDGNKLLGNYKVLDSAIGRELRKIKKVKGNPIFKLYKFDKKV